MGLRRYKASQDTTITNAFEANLQTRGTGSNMGASDILEIFSIANQANSASNERSRILIEWDLTDAVADRAAGTIPASGSTNWIIKLTNAEHPLTVPSGFTMLVQPVSQSWEEGFGLDMEEYSDLTRDAIGANWINAGSGTQWTAEGGDYLSSYIFSQSFDDGIEDLEVDVTDLVEAWIAGAVPNNGVGIFLSGSAESGSAQSFYTKRFFARTSEFFFRQPILEARFDSTRKDNRGNFVASSSLLSLAENTNTIYLYNNFRGQPRNIPAVGTGPVLVDFYSDPVTGTLIGGVTGGYVETGVYSASVVLDTTASVVYDRWFSGSEVFHTGVIEVDTQVADNSVLQSQGFLTTITNLKHVYSPEENVRFRLFTRQRNWSPTIYRKAREQVQGQIVDDVYFKISRVTDEVDEVEYGTGSLNHTRLSYDVSGSYFDFDMAMLEPGYAYGIKFMFNIDGKFEEQPNTFKFRVESEL